MEYLPDRVHHAVSPLCTFFSTPGPLWHGDMVRHCAYTQRLFLQSLCQSVQHVCLHLHRYGIHVKVPILVGGIEPVRGEYVSHDHVRICCGIQLQQCLSGTCLLIGQHGAIGGCCAGADHVSDVEYGIYCPATAHTYDGVDTIQIPQFLCVDGGGCHAHASRLHTDGCALVGAGVTQCSPHIVHQSRFLEIFQCYPSCPVGISRHQHRGCVVAPFCFIVWCHTTPSMCVPSDLAMHDCMHDPL